MLASENARKPRTERMLFLAQWLLSVLQQLGASLAESYTEVASWILTQALKMPTGSCCVDVEGLPASELAVAVHTHTQSVQAQAE